MPAPPRRPLVALALPPGEELATAIDEAWRDGAAVMPMDPHAPAPVRQQTLTAMQPESGVDDGIALVITTSGSTGVPKGAELSHATLEASASATMARIGRRDDDCWLACLPWHHIGGLQVLLRARLFGTPLVVHDRFDVARVAGEFDATLVSLVPTQLVRLLDAGVDLSRFRAILLGGAPAPPALLDRARAAGAALVTTYGMSETCGGCVYDGVPLDGVEVRIGGDGRVQLRGPVLMSGYRLQPTLTAEVFEDGWFVTSDVGRLAPDGRLTVHGRIDDVAVTGGENIATSDVAAALTTHPQVMEAAVAAIPDTEWGQRLVAVVVAASAPPTLEELRAWCRRTLPPAAAPRGLVLVEEIPLLSSGKPDRLAIQSIAATSVSAAHSGDRPSRA